MIDLDRLPDEIRIGTRCVLWNYEERDGKRTKVPYVPTRPGERASSTDPGTWGTFEEACTAYLEGKSDGMGFNLGDGWLGVDIDKCRDPQTSAITPEALAIITALDSYTEVSPSGTGVKVFLRGCLPPVGRKKGPIEMYDRARFFTVTGQHLEGTPRTIEERTTQLAALHARIFGSNGDDRKPHTSGPTRSPDPDDAALIERARRAKNGDTFTRLWAGDISGHPSHSEADLALCNLLAFWTTRDHDRIDRLFRQSGLMRSKWDERHGAQTYGEMTIGKAIANCHETYSGARYAEATDTTVGGIEHLTDLGNARRLVTRHGDRLRFCYPWNGWMVYAGAQWTRNAIGDAERCAKETTVAIYEEAHRGVDEDRRKLLAKHAMRSESAQRIHAMLELAKSEPGIAVEPEELDRDPWLFNVRNGTIDLRTGMLREHRREDLITKLVPVDHDPEATAPMWEAFLERIMAGNTDLIAFLQRAVGYSLTGSTQEQSWFLLHGVGANGKTTMLRTLTDLLGDYAAWTPTQTLLAKRGEHIENDLARLRGIRMVVAVETDSNRRLAESLVKQVTAGDAVTARFLYGEYFSFIPTFKLWFATNHKPQIRGTDHAVWRRIRLIPFQVVIPDEEQDKNLPEKLRAEFPGILAWAVQGCRAWQREGLGMPEAVREATSEYRASQDIIAVFLAECCLVDPEAVVGATDLFKSYVNWCEGAKEQAETQTRFGESLTERGFRKDRHAITKRIVRHGLRLMKNTQGNS
jgi:putative DNA primase/helicase